MEVMLGGAENGGGGGGAMVTAGRGADTEGPARRSGAGTVQGSYRLVGA